MGKADAIAGGSRKPLEKLETIFFSHITLGMIQFTALRWTMSNASFDIRPEAEKLWQNFLSLVC